MNRIKNIGVVLLIAALCLSGRCATAGDVPKPKVKWGISLITWGPAFETGIEEAAQLGLKGIQPGINVYEAYKNKPAELRSKLKKAGLRMPAFSAGQVEGDPEKRQAQIQEFTEIARFVKSAGGKYLQAGTRKRDAYPPGKDKLLQLATALNEIGEAVRKTGIRLLIHPQMQQMCETPEELKFIMENTKPDLVGLVLDAGHYSLAGGNPAEAVLTYRKRIELVHIQDVVSPFPGHQGSKKTNFRFVEAGKGNKINWQELMKSLKKSGFKGWCMIETDAPADTKASPKTTSQNSLDFLSTTFGYRFGKK